MNSKLIMKSDILDIVFENRNKEYGAYNLRKFYPGRIKIALGLMFIISIGFSAFTLIPVKKTVHISVYDIPEIKFTKPDNAIKEPEKKQEIKKPEAMPLKKAVPVKQKMFVSNTLIVPDNMKADSIKDLLSDDKISTVTVQTPGDKPAVIVPEKNEKMSENGNDAATPKVDVNKPMNEDAVDVLPAYPGGMNALIKFLQKNLETPDEIQDGQAVNVRIKFVVGYNGKLQSFVTVLDGGTAYNNEVVRVLRKMPDWIPGKAKGENVSVYYTIPVKFVSEN